MATIDLFLRELAISLVLEPFFAWSRIMRSSSADQRGGSRDLWLTMFDSIFRGLPRRPSEAYVPTSLMSAFGFGGLPCRPDATSVPLMSASCFGGLPLLFGGLSDESPVANALRSSVPRSMGRTYCMPSLRLREQHCMLLQCFVPHGAGFSRKVAFWQPEDKESISQLVMVACCVDHVLLSQPCFQLR